MTDDKRVGKKPKTTKQLGLEKESLYLEKLALKALTRMDEIQDALDILEKKR